MATEDNNKITWFVAGAAIGAAVALLYAPKSGRETRSFLVEKTASGREAVNETGKDLYEKGRDLYEKGKRVADDAAELFDRGRKLVRG